MERKEFTGTKASIAKDIILLAIGIAIFGFVAYIFATEAGPLNGVYSRELGNILGWLIAIVWTLGLVFIVKNKIQGIPKVILENNSVLIYKGEKLAHDFNIHSSTFEGSIIRRRGVPIGYSLLVDAGEGKKYVNLDGINVKVFQELMAEINKVKKV